MMKEELGLGMADCVDGLDLSPFTKGTPIIFSS